MKQNWLCLLLLGTLGCAGSPQEPTVDLEAERSALMKADQALFESHDDVAEFVTFLADNATFMPDDAPLARGEAIGATWEQLISMPGFHLEWQAAGAEVADAGDLGYTIGTYELTVAPEGAPLVTVGKYVTVWKKQADGSWKVVVDCFNADGPPAEG